MGGIIYNTAVQFKRLFAIEYDIIVARKGKAEYLKIHFKKEHFYHLCGLQHISKNTYLKTAPKEQIYDAAISQEIDDSVLYDGEYPYSDAEERVLCVANIERYLDMEDLYFRWNYEQKLNSRIRAEYLIDSGSDSLPCYLFVDKDSYGHYCKSIFSSKNDINGEYLKGLSKYALLYKRKRFLDTGECELQVDRKALTKEQFEGFGVL